MNAKRSTYDAALVGVLTGRLMPIRLENVDGNPSPNAEKRIVHHDLDDLVKAAADVAEQYEAEIQGRKRRRLDASKSN